MIRNISYNNPETKNEIISHIGRPYSLKNRFKLRGTGSPKYLITEASKEIQDKLSLDNNLNYCNIELRPGGIIVGFRSLLETFGWILPFHEFSLVPLNHSYSLRSDDNYIIMNNNLRFGSGDEFLKKLVRIQNDYVMNKSV